MCVCTNAGCDRVWVHNHPLLLLPSLIREIHQKCRIGTRHVVTSTRNSAVIIIVNVCVLCDVCAGLFIQTPFPSSDIFRVLPTCSTLLRSMMSADLIGFHTFDYARHFLSAVKRVCDVDYDTLPGGRIAIKFHGRFISVLISHVGIDANFFRAKAQSLQVKERTEQIR